jgi:hypothetical protein
VLAARTSSSSPLNVRRFIGASSAAHIGLLLRDFLEDQVADDSRLTAPGFGRELGQQTTLELIQQRRENGSRHGWTAMKRKKRMRILHLESPSAIPKQ